VVLNQREEACPVCGIDARITRKWVVNNYGKRYDYLIYHHQGYVHYSNQDKNCSKGFRKGKLEKILIETINSQDFKLGSFRIMEIKKLLANEYPDVGFGSLKVSLNRLAEVGIVEKQRKGRKLIFINTVSKERLSFVISSISIGLEDVSNDLGYKRHDYIYRVKNDHSWPLYFIPFRAVGDVDTAFADIKFLAFESSNNSVINVIVVEDAPKDKRLLLKLPSPLLPGEAREIRFEYHWSEPKLMYVFSAATRIDDFNFSVSGNNLAKLTVSFTSGSTNETRDLSNEVIETQSLKWKSIRSIKVKDVEPFAVIQLKWK
jgi:hypothetical protein